MIIVEAILAVALAGNLEKVLESMQQLQQSLDTSAVRLEHAGMK